MKVLSRNKNGVKHAVFFFLKFRDRNNKCRMILYLSIRQKVRDFNNFPLVYGFYSHFAITSAAEDMQYDFFGLDEAQEVINSSGLSLRSLLIFSASSLSVIFDLLGAFLSTNIFFIL